MSLHVACKLKLGASCHDPLLKVLTCPDPSLSLASDLEGLTRDKMLHIGQRPKRSNQGLGLRTECFLGRLPELSRAVSGAAGGPEAFRAQVSSWTATPTMSVLA